LLHIDLGDLIMADVVQQEKQRRRFKLKSLQTDLVKGYSTLWKPLNPLFKLTHPDAYFVVNLSDEMLFLTKGWDTMLRPYIGYYPDHLFRLRGSKYRFRNYTDFWECGFAPDSLAFYTKRWLDLQGEWNPCLGPDSFQQCVAFYLYTSDAFSHRQFNRDIPLAFMRFEGEGASIGLEGTALHKRMCINNRAWFVLMSHKMQQEAKRRAMLMKAHIVAHDFPGAVIEHAAADKCYTVKDASGHALERISYKRSWFATSFRNWLRSPFVFYFAGGGMHNLRNSPLSGVVMMLSTYTWLGPSLLGRAFGIRHTFRHIRGVAQTHGTFVSLVTCAEITGSVLLPDAVKRHIREPYRSFRLNVIRRANHLKGVSGEHGKVRTAREFFRDFPGYGALRGARDYIRALRTRDMAHKAEMPAAELPRAEDRPNPAGAFIRRQIVDFREGLKGIAEIARKLPQQPWLKRELEDLRLLGKDLKEEARTLYRVFVPAKPKD
jgi:hypothetical protein